MIHEFAIEPEVMATWEHFRVLWNALGVCQGRFLVEYPKNWRKQVYGLVDKHTKPVRANSIKSKLADRALRQAKLVGPSGRPYPGEPWLASTVAQQSSDKPFHAIVANEAMPDRDDVLAAAEFDHGEPPWKVETQCRCSRTVAAITGAASCLLRHSKELVLVDRNFDPSEPRFQEPFEAMVNIRADWARLELHAALPKEFRSEALEAKFRQNLAALIPARVTLRVCLWPNLPERERLHARFVLTERGGIHFDYGLDEGQSPEETTLVSLLEHKIFLKYRQDYRQDAGTFGQPTCIEIAARA